MFTGMVSMASFLCDMRKVNTWKVYCLKGQTKLCLHSPPSTITHHQPKYIHHNPPPPTTSQNIITTCHHHPPLAKIYPSPPTTTHHQPRYTYQHPPRPTNIQNLFYKKPIYKNLQPLSDGKVRNLNSRPAIAEKLFLYMALSIIFTAYTRIGLKKLQCERTFIICETSFEKRQAFKC